MRVLDVTTSIAGPVLRPDPRRARRRRDQGRAAGHGRRRPRVGPAVLGRRGHDVPLGERGQALARASRCAIRADARRCCGSLDGADVFLQSLRPGLAERLGLGADDAARAQPAARLLLGRRVRARRAAARGAGLRRADAGRGRADLDDGRAGPAGRPRRLVADRPGHRDVGGARHPRGAARARATGEGSRRRRLALRDGARLHRLPPRRLPRRRHGAARRREPASRWSRPTRCCRRGTAS